MNKKIIFTANFNAALNREVDQIFTYIRPLNGLDYKLNEDYEIIFKDVYNTVLVGVATIEDIKKFPFSQLSNALALVTYGYPLSSAKTILQKKYSDELKNENSFIMLLVFRWKEKYITGLKTINRKKDKKR